MRFVYFVQFQCRRGHTASSLENVLRQQPRDQANKHIIDFQSGHFKRHCYLQFAQNYGIQPGQKLFSPGPIVVEAQCSTETSISSSDIFPCLLLCAGAVFVLLYCSFPFLKSTCTLLSSLTCPAMSILLKSVTIFLSMYLLNGRAP
mmetsp:Transcript_6929/g.25907  ORF Transcript_6929/g.25907 Transcript_6929/m.25907 type:complete len:146 (+) Transcript_6929:1360-1797(+)